MNLDIKIFTCVLKADHENLTKIIYDNNEVID